MRKEEIQDLIRLVEESDISELEVTEIRGAQAGDVLCYSAASGDVNGDGVPDLLVNEMLGNTPSAADVGNLLLIDGPAVLPIFADSFESGDTSAWSGAVSR